MFSVQQCTGIWSLRKHAESGKGYLSTDFKHEFQIQFMVNSLYQRLCSYWKTSAIHAPQTAPLSYKINKHNFASRSQPGWVQGQSLGHNHPQVLTMLGLLRWADIYRATSVFPPCITVTQVTSTVGGAHLYNLSTTVFSPTFMLSFITVP